MSFQDAVRTCLSKYATFSGRAGRPEYWWFFLFNFIVSIITNIIDRAVGNVLIGSLVSLALLVPSIAVLVRRLHDTNRSGWWALLILIPIVGWIVLIIFAAMPGDQGPNTHGAPQNQPSGARI